MWGTAMAGLTSIPVNLRPQTITVRIPKAGTYGGAYEEPFTVSHVRFDKSAALGTTDYRLLDGVSGLVFIDATSEGARDIPTGSLVMLDGETLEVKQCKRLETFGGAVHHWEVQVG